MVGLLEGDWFSVSFPGSKKEGKKELAGFKLRNLGNYIYKLKQNPDKKGWTIFAKHKLWGK